MTSFIVISTDDNLHWILDGIQKCHPVSTLQNKSTIIDPFISEGRIIEQQDGLRYVYTAGEEDKTDDEQTLSAVFQNHVAAFKNQANVGNGVINIFVLYNIDDNKEEKRKWIFDEINQIVKANTINLHTVLLSFNQSHPTGTTKRASSEQIRAFIEYYRESTKDIPSANILYINNLDENGAATWTSKEEHEWLIPRMLCDWFMVLSSQNTKADLLNAVNSSTKIYALGYAEYAYLPKHDLERYLEIALKRDMVDALVLKGPADIGNADRPIIGLYAHKKAKEKRCEEVDLTCDIDEYPDTIDYEIEQHLCWFSKLVEAINRGIEQKNEALEKEYQEKLAQAKEEAEEGQEMDSSDDEAHGTPIPEPEYIPTIPFTTRKDVYDYYISLPLEDDQQAAKAGEDESFNTKIDEWKASWGKAKDFKTFISLYNEFAHEMVAEEASASREHVDAPQEPSRAGCLPFSHILKLFKGTSSEDKSTPTPPQPTATHPIDFCTEIRKKSIAIQKLEEERRRYKELLNKIDTEEQTLEKLQKDVESYHLTSDGKLINICDLNQMAAYEASISQAMLDNVLADWKSYIASEKSPLRSKLDEILQEKVFFHVKQHWHLDWTKPYDFVESINEVREAEVCESLQQKSAPFVCYNDDRPQATNLKSYYYFTNNSDLVGKINKKTLKIPEQNLVMAKESKYIVNKVCIFQILQIDDYLLDHCLTDLVQKDGMNTDNTDSQIPDSMQLEEEFWGAQ